MITRSCANCDLAINAINGRLCLLLRKYRDVNSVCERFSFHNIND